MAIGTNKLSSSCGTSLATARFIRRGLVNWRLAVPGIAAAMLGSFLGSRLSLLASEGLIRGVLFLVLPLAAFVVLNPRLFPERAESEPRLDRRSMWACTLSASCTLCILVHLSKQSLCIVHELLFLALK